MPWAKLSDDFFTNPKVEKVGNAGAGLFARVLSYTGKYPDQEGEVPRTWLVKQLGPGERKLPQRLVDAGLLEEVDGGYVVHDWHEHQGQLDPERVEAGRERNRQRVAAHRARKKAARESE